MPRFNPDVVNGFQDGMNNAVDKQYNIKDTEAINIENMEYFDNRSLMVRRGTAKLTTSEFSGPVTSIHSLDSKIMVTSGSKVYVGRTVEVPDFVMGGDPPNTLAYSTDGINWTGLGDSIFSGYCDAIATNGSMWVAGGGGTNSLAWSDDGLNWNGLGVSVFTNVYGLAYSADLVQWIAVGDGPNTLAYSADGVNWTGVPGVFMVDGDGANWNPDLGLWIALGSWDVTAGYQNSWATSANGTAWTEENVNPGLFSVFGYSAAWNGTKWVAVGQGTNTIAHSADGIAWTGIGNAIFSGLGANICWSEDVGLFVAGGNGTNTLARSANGTAWTGEGSSVFSITCRGVCWSPTHNKFVAVGHAVNSIAYSSNGIDWTGVGLSITASAFAVAARV